MEVEYLFPAGVDEAVALLEQYGERGRLVAGGTDLLLAMERSGYHPQALIDLTRISDLKRLEVEDDCVSIGAAVTYREILACRALTDRVPFLADAIRQIGGAQVRNIATLAGNIANASPAGDSLPPLYVLDAVIHTAGSDCRRSFAIRDFILGVRRLASGPAEIVTHVTFHLPPSGWPGAFAKIGARRAMAISIANMAVLAHVEAGRVEEARIALGAVAPTVIRAGEAEAYLAGRMLNDETIREAAGLAARASRPIDDVRASGRYRQQVIEGVARRTLQALRARIEG